MQVCDHGTTDLSRTIPTSSRLADAVQNHQADDVNMPSMPEIALEDDDWLLFGHSWAEYFPTNISP
jgi:hypothetical protein